MSRWSAADLARVNAKLSQSIASPLEPTAGFQKVDHRLPKYHNQPVQQDGMEFDSKLEAKRYRELKLLQKSGSISRLEFHRHWDLHVNNINIGYYEADFTYQENGKTVIEDTKGVKTALYRWKKKHVLAEYGIEIREITA